MKTKTMINTKFSRFGGFTMVELLIAVIIIGILVTIIVPVLSNRAADARIAAAKADMEAIANAQSQVALDTGYVVRLHVLDDSGALSDNLGNGTVNDVVDTIRDEDVHEAGNPDLIFLDAKSGEILPNPSLFQRVEADPEQFGWRGPYVNYQRKLPIDVPARPIWVAGAPLDPWGNPYFLFVPGPEIAGTAATGFWVNELTGTLDNTFSYNGVGGIRTDLFDRLTVLSLGPNGLPGTGVAPNDQLGMGDDLIRAF